MSTSVSKRILRVVIAAAVILTCYGSQLRAQSVAVMVNGEAITNFDIEQRTKLTVLSTQKSPSRQEVIDELINEKVKIKEGKKYSIEPGSSEVDSAFGSMSSRMRITPDQLVQSLASKGIRPNTLKSRLKADMVWNALVRGRFKQSLQVGEKEVEAAVQSAGGDSNAEAFEYQLRPMVLIVPRGAPASQMESRKREADAVRERVQTCEEANSTFKSMQNATIRDTVTKTSADIPANLRDLLDKTPVGHLTPPEVTKQGIEMVALCSRKPTKIDTPKKREIREKMFAEKFEAKSKAYLQEVRKAAMIEYRQ
ncbi:SurA N-terminal domain-containing protein [Rhodopseudomonas sp. P2A-2r]|uniref:SurA N-terminal domain-containing protein n=1 Tax=unclassified Rhodopseudomonas TaxID=2638247 RepID=UPI00223428B2|nr:SurA N-terminal domain-containing protein [Rhodopseudomonas sp. P2A-2r]UZE47275.1 SurA N-terminal domain-containing protein [Rhodopseudomonas sp. P2A-2r]